ncbi:dihydrodipicolinate synthase family protein [Pseudonocardia spinosispora]|uniref:dihydrodipicolinate synthase family protein n=1 Tax=Pseudonocardia spinosispora TaxID=103441 RepID=UPI000419269B|nr:dihydrodipicolinate synthase family protein [Pseudonocardia spinosispora]
MARRLFGILPTPFLASGRVDLNAAVENLRRATRLHKINSVLLGGAYGEFTGLTDTERVELVEAVHEGCPNAEIMGCSATLSTAGTIELSRRMSAAGASLRMVTAPLAQELTDRDVIRHFARLGTELGRGLVAYNNVVFGRDLSREVLASVLDDEAYVGIKQGTPSIRSFLLTLELARGAAAQPFVIAASDLVAPMTLAAGADGLSSTNVWVFPDAVLGTIEAIERGDVQAAARLHRTWSDYRELAGRLGQPATVKAAMCLRGYSGTRDVRAPLAALDDPERAELEKVIARCDQAYEREARNR